MFKSFLANAIAVTTVMIARFFTIWKENGKPANLMLRGLKQRVPLLQTVLLPVVQMNKCTLGLVTVLNT